MHIWCGEFTLISIHISEGLGDWWSPESWNLITFSPLHGLPLILCCCRGRRELECWPHGQYSFPIGICSRTLFDLPALLILLFASSRSGDRLKVGDSISLRTSDKDWVALLIMYGTPIHVFNISATPGRKIIQERHFDVTHWLYCSTVHSESIL